MQLRYYIGLLIIILYQVSADDNYFCYPTCKKRECKNRLYDSCKSCRNDFVMNMATLNNGLTACIAPTLNNISTSAKWQPIGASVDIGYNLEGAFTQQQLIIGNAALTPSACTRNSNYDYTYFGNITSADTVTIEHPGFYDSYFYRVRLTYGVMFLDKWDWEGIVITKFTSNTSQSVRDKFITKQSDQKYHVCGLSNSGSQQKYRVIQQNFSFSGPNPINFQITTSVNTNNKPWGLMWVILEVRLCHAYCIKCSGDTNNQCTQCNWADSSARLSNTTTCALNCLSTWGTNSADPGVCIKCVANCTSCQQLVDNCTVCKTGYFLYNNGTQVLCNNKCPDHQFPNTTTKSCQMCDEICFDCQTVSSKCISCNSTYYFYNNTCHKPCPDSTYENNTLPTKCFNCDNLCSICSVNSTYCSVCEVTGIYKSYLLGDKCTKQCGKKFFQDDKGGAGPTQCKTCSFQCATCDLNATYCFSCQPNFYYLDNDCNSSCPFPAYFPDKNSWKCLDCATYCVNMSMGLYYKDNLKQQLICDLNFAQDLDWGATQIKNFIQISIGDPSISINSFEIIYQPVTPRIMRIRLTPKGYIFIYNITFTFTTISFNGTHNLAINGYRFSDSDYGVSKSIVWFLIKAPSLSQTQKNIIDSVSKFSDKILAFTTLPYVQEIKKTGIFAMLLGGAQVTSTACLINTIPSQNFYEGVRLWASFVFFDVPPWEMKSNRTKYVVVPSIQDVIKDARLLNYEQKRNNRTLFDSQSVEWRFQRTGHTSFFIFDTYVNISLICLCWILLAIGNFCIKNKISHKRAMGMFYSLTHKIHQISIFYISLTTLLQWIYFDAASMERWISFGLCLLFNIYFLFYELYIYYDMIGYPSAQIGNQKYEYFCLRYGSLLKNIRFQQYDTKQQWSARHWWRPYNYHILSYYKKFLMMISLPIFYNTPYAQVSVLIVIQLFEMLRFLVVWPFHSKVRNILRFGLECCLMMFFISILVQSFMMAQIIISDPNTIEKSVQVFYKMGWVGFCMVFTFNIGYLLFFIYDTAVGFKYSNRQMIDRSRKFYYMQRLNTYEQENQDVPLALVNRWVKLGNLNNRKYDLLPDINLRVELYRVLKATRGYQIEMRKLFDVYMNIQFNFNQQNNITAGKKVNKRFTLDRSLSPAFFCTIDELYKKYAATMDFQYMSIKTFQKVIQSDLKPGQKIPLKPEIMLQKIELQTYAGQKKLITLDKLLPGFPLAYEDLNKFL